LKKAEGTVLERFSKGLNKIRFQKCDDIRTGLWLDIIERPFNPYFRGTSFDFGAYLGFS
jgi:hypothetical protein